jgi:hypothetical protein
VSAFLEHRANLKRDLALALQDKPAAAEPAASPQGPTADGTARPKVLLAEDHPINQRVIQAILGDAFDLTIVANGQAALDAQGEQAQPHVCTDGVVGATEPREGCVDDRVDGERCRDHGHAGRIVELARDDQRGGGVSHDGDANGSDGQQVATAKV